MVKKTFASKNVGGQGGPGGNESTPTRVRLKDTTRAQGHHCRTCKKAYSKRCHQQQHEGYCPVCFVRYGYTFGCNLHGFATTDLIAEPPENKLELSAKYEAMGLIGDRAAVEKRLKEGRFEVRSGLVVDLDEEEAKRQEVAAAVAAAEAAEQERVARAEAAILQTYGIEIEGVVAEVDVNVAVGDEDSVAPKDVATVTVEPIAATEDATDTTTNGSNGSDKENAQTTKKASKVKKDKPKKAWATKIKESINNKKKFHTKQAKEGSY